MVATATLADIAARFHAAGRGCEVKGVLGSIREKARVQEISEALAGDAVKLRLRHKLGLADAIILATARVKNALLVTGGSDFKNLEDTVIILIVSRKERELVKRPGRSTWITPSTRLASFRACKQKSY